MKRLALLIARLYPYAWRQRYGHEMDALIQDSKPSFPWLLDTLKGALTMQIKSNGLRVALFGIAGALIAASTLAINDYYVCSAVLNVRDTNAVSTVIQQALARRSLWPIIAKNGLYESDRNHIPNEDIIEKFRHAIFIKPIQNQQAITVSYHGTDRVIAKTVTEDLAQLFMRDSRNIGALVEISLPQRRGGHKRIFIFFEGLCVGLFAGACYVRLMAMRRAA